MREEFESIQDAGYVDLDVAAAAHDMLFGSAALGDVQLAGKQAAALLDKEPSSLRCPTVCPLGRHCAGLPVCGSYTAGAVSFASSRACQQAEAVGPRATYQRCT